MLSIARSRLALPAQLLFLALNGAGIFCGAFYNVNTPDLYANNAHHKIGWVATWIVTAQVAMSLLFAYRKRSRKEVAVLPAETASFLPISVDAMAQHQQLPNPHAYQDNRWSGDSGQGTERASSSLHSRDLSPTGAAPRREEYEQYQKLEEAEDDNDVDQRGVPPSRDFYRGTFVQTVLKRRLLAAFFSQRALKVFKGLYDGVDRIILLLGFIALATGGVTYAGIFVSGYLSKIHPHTVS